MTHPAVVECAITGVPDEIRGQVVKATIVLAKEYKARTGEELVKELQNHVKKVTAPTNTRVSSNLLMSSPKPSAGKSAVWKSGRTTGNNTRHPASES